MSLAKKIIKWEMSIKMIYNITTVKNIFQYQMAKFNNANCNYFYNNLIEKSQTWCNYLKY